MSDCTYATCYFAYKINNKYLISETLYNSTLTQETVLKFNDSREKARMVE